MLNNDSPFNITRYTDTYGNLAIKKRTNRQFQIYGGKIETGETLVESNHVYIDGLYETAIQNQITDSTYFKVDYKEGVIYFHPSKEGQFVNINFYAKAKVDWKALNVVLQDENNLYNATNAEDAFEEIATRVNNIVANVGNSNSEIVDLRVDVNNVIHPTAKNRADSDYNNLNNKMGIFDENNITEASLAEAINNDRIQLSNDGNMLSVFNKVFSNGLIKYGLGTNVFGSEYLSKFHNKILTRTMSTALNVCFIGDSTTAGVAVDSAYNLTTLFSNRTVRELPNINFLNHGHSGVTSSQWVQLYVNDDISTNADLFVIRLGINDPKMLKNGTLAPADAGLSYPNRRDASDVDTSIRQGITALRQASPNCPIVLMTPNSVYDYLNGINTDYMETLIPVLKKIARDLQCCFINTYQLFQDSYSAIASDYMDSPYSDDRHVHPKNVFNVWIVDKMYDVIFPPFLRYLMGTMKLSNIAMANQVISASYPPNIFDMGISMHVGSPDFPLGGSSPVLTFRWADQFVIQMNYSSDMSKNIVKCRLGNVGLWSGWFDMTYQKPSFTSVTLLNGYVNLGGGYSTAKSCIDSNNIVRLKGFVKAPNNSVSVSILTLPVGQRPSEITGFSCRTQSGYADIYVYPSGNVQIMSGDASGYVVLDNINFLAEQ